MEVCPYCKKSFKRLKSHLPHCKSLRPTTPADQNVSQSQLPPHTHAHGRKRNSETEEKNPKSIISGLRGSPAGTVQVEEVMIGMKKTALLHHLVAEAHGNAEKSLPVGKMPLKIQGSKSYSAADSATGRNFESTRPSPGQTAPSESLSVSQPYHPSLPSLALKTLQEEKADARSQSRVAGLQTLLNGEERAAPEPRSVPHCQASHTGHLRPLSAAWYHPAQTPFSPVHAADRRACPSSVGLEWFPELYPGYLGLGVLPRKPQYWDAVVSKPQLINPPGEELSQGWTRCSSLARRSRGGSIAMLFTGYFVLCCSWSVRRLRLQRWRKQC
ncbi:mitochondrial nucleoid-associated protein 1 [Rhynchocyon petersi]